MKGLLKNIVFALIIGLVSINAAQAKDITPTDFTIGNVVLINFQGIKSEVAHVSLYDQDGEVLWSDVIRNASTFRKQFNFAQLPDGMYTVILKDGDKEYIREVKKAIDKTYIVSMRTKTIYKPETTVTAKHMIVDFPATDSKIEKVSFRDIDGEVFFTDTVGSYEGPFHKSYDYSKLPSGVFIVSITTNEKSFYKELIVK